MTPDDQPRLNYNLSLTPDKEEGNTFMSDAPVPLFRKASLAAFLAVAGRERPRIFNNPVILRELIDRLRKKSSFVYLALFLAVAIIILSFLWPEYVRSYANPSPYVYPYGTQSRGFFLFLNLFPGIFLFLLAPLLSATSVNLEYERETWELLATTHLSPASILLAKWISSIFFIWILSLSLIPIYGICFTMGGVSPEEVGFIFLIYTEVTAITAAIGLYCSVVWKHTVKSITFTYLGSFAYLVLLPLLGIYTNGILFVASPFVIAIAYFSGPSPIPSMGSPAWLINHFYLTHGVMIAGLIALLFLITYWRLYTKQEYSDAEQFKGYFRSLAQRLRRYVTIASRVKDFNLMKDGRNPIAFRELHALRGRYRLRMLFSMAFWLGVSFCFYLPWSPSSRPPHFQIVDWADTMPFAAILLTPLFIIPYAANCFRHEKDRGTWDLLATTTLTPWRIVWGKMAAGWRMFHWKFWAFYGVFLFLSLAYFHNSPPMYIAFDFQRIQTLLATIIFAIPLGYVSAGFYLAAGILVSSLMRKTLSAYALMFFLAIGILFLFPMAILFSSHQLALPPPNSPSYQIITSISPVLLLSRYAEFVHQPSLQLSKWWYTFRTSDWMGYFLYHCAGFLLLTWVLSRLAADAIARRNR